MAPGVIGGEAGRQEASMVPDTIYTDVRRRDTPEASECPGEHLTTARIRRKSPAVGATCGALLALGVLCVCFCTS